MTTEAQLDETAIIARDLIRFDTTNYGEGRSNGETDAAEYVGQKLIELGLEPLMFEGAPGRTSVIAHVKGHGVSTGSSREKGKLVVHGHLDVVPAVADNWSVDPFEGVIKDGMLWGRGAVDMKNMDAMILTALGDILKSGERPARDLIIAFFADEEAGGVFGSGYLVREHPELFEGATEAISEVGGYSITVGEQRAYLLQTGEKALIWAKLVARGTAGHGSRIHPDNAITRLAEAVAKVGKLEWPVRLTDTTEQLLGEIARILGVDPQRVGPDELALATGTASNWIQASLRNTANPTMLASGYKHNVIPDTAEAALDIRAFPGEEDAVLAAIQDAVGPDIEVVTSFRDVGTETTFDGALVDAVKTTLERHDPGAPVLPYLLAAGTDNKALSKLGIRGFGFAPLKLPADLDFPGMFHGVDERVPLDSLVFGRRVLRDLLLEY
ncbi:M20/M25/M40 family metallo-hydrolase [Salinibacterium sp. dk2585]|uniref:M20/M25/M40 family metallo-hydrolase n=1 Tax=unclassified Salinibacterium TaxID=2632331 RepID=UPI0011C2557D|nr:MULTISPECIES: M20/M25/M40 family metallo-hydrolase [unclassified Salinibacterium]QEE61163.1 M20/M25/M40 family metallo-hydrolase [Salinibacterium sp. dk2585]TXK53106.1 M20/M25/M40 family metallo-hydrolase [Salinibacterium sp. dk5596]